MSEEVVVVVSGGDPPAPGCRARGAARRARHRRRQRARARARARPRGRPSRSATSTRRRPRPSRSRRQPACASSVTRRRRTRPTSSSPSTSRCAMSPRRILVLASRGGRLDHELATLLLLGSDRYATRGDRRVHRRCARPRRAATGARFEGEPGELITLLAVNGPAVGVTTEGLAYPLRGETLEPGLESRSLERLRGRGGAHLGRRRRPARHPTGRSRSDTAAARCCCGAPGRRAARRRRLRRQRRAADRGRARHARLVRDLEGREAGVRGRRAGSR